MSEGENKFDLGDRVDVLNMSAMPTPNMLPHPQGEHDPWATAENADAQFGAEATPAPKQGAGLDVGGYNPSAQQAPSAPPQAAPQAQGNIPASPGKRPVPKVAKVSRKETHLLKKFRETFGLKRIDVAEGTLVRRDPQDPEQNVEMKFGLRGLNYEDYQWVLDKAASLQQNPLLVAFAWKIAVCSLGTASVEGQPIWEVLGFEPESPEHVADPMYPHLGLRFQAAEAWCAELTGSLFDTVEDIYKLYEEKVDKQYYAKPDEPEEGEDGPLDQTESNS